MRRIPWRREIPLPEVAFLLLLGLLLQLLAPSLLYLLFHHQFKLAPDAVWGGTLLVFDLFLAGVLLGAIKFLPSQGTVAAKLGLRAFKTSDIVPLLIGVGLVVAGNLLTIPWQALLDRLEIPYRLTQELVDIVAGASPFWFGILVFCVAGLTPLCEEILFRRLLFSAIRPWCGGWGSVLLTSGVFSLVHLFLLGIPGLFLMGIAFQFVYLKTRNLGTAVLLHALVNLTALLAAAAGLEEAGF